MRRVFLPLLAVAAACETGFERPSLLLDLRVLAVRADPAEVVVDFDPAMPVIPEMPPVRLTTLVVDPLGPRPLRWTMTACPEHFRRRCLPERPSVRFAEGTTSGAPEAVLVADAALLRAALEHDDFLGLGGVPVQIVLTLRPEDAPEEETLYAGKIVFYAPRIPAGRTANANPRIDQLLVDGQPFAEGEPPRVVARGAQVELEPVEPEGVREPYVVTTLDGDTRPFTENLRYSWFADGGRISDEQTGGAIDMFGNVPLLRTRWRAPETPGTVSLWVVQRDERGGAFWTQRTLQVE